MSAKPTRRGFLAFMALFGVLLLLVGIWEWMISGAFHNLVLGSFTLLVTGVASLISRRRLKTDAS
jgi:hypothetical protein